MKPVDPTPPPSPRVAGMVSLTAGLLAAAGAAGATMAEPSAVKKGFLIALPVALVGLFTGAAGRSTRTGQFGLVLSALVALAGSVAVLLLIART